MQHLAEGEDASMRWKVALVVLLLLWLAGVLLVGLLLNRYRIDQGATVLVLDEARGWGLHRMDLLVIAIATLPLLVAALIATLARLAPVRQPQRSR